MTKGKFKKDPKLRSQLAEILENPVWSQAVELVKQGFQPSGTIDSVNTIKKVSCYDEQAGMLRFLKQLKDLTQPCPDKKRPQFKAELAKSEADLSELPR